MQFFQLNILDSPLKFINVYTLVSISVLLFVLHQLIKNRRIIKLGNKIPSAQGHLLGCFSLIIKGPEQIIPEFIKIAKLNDYKIMKSWIFNQLYIGVLEPEELKQALNDPNIFKKSKEYDILKNSIFGNGLFTETDMDAWKKSRKAIVKGMSILNVKQFIPIFYEEAKILGEVMFQKRDSHTHECDICEPVSNATMDTFGRTTMGENFNSQKNNHHLFIENIDIIKEVWAYRIFKPWFRSSTLFSLSSMKKRHDKSLYIVQSFVENLVMKAKNKKDNDLIEILDSADNKNNKPFAEVMLENTNIMTYKQICHNIMGTIMAGQDTSFITNTCVLFMIATHQDVQKKLVEELDTIFSDGEKNRQPTYEDLHKMDYLEMTIKETLRLFPPVPFIGREVSKETTIGKYVIPKGATICIIPKAIHSNPSLYSNPEKFNPDNFLPEACLKRHPYSFISFSGGYKNCAGIKYAMLQAKTVISTVIRSYHLYPSDKCPTPDKLRTALSGVLTFVDGCPIKIERREL
ncbi:cytochrome P450 4C1-like isoform X2 [Daktulosphaira vitifoliae]|uniref:cytochrome P450 4C1-like isoform X2 n=1 Tax=Daktulosphaira vitifoliae TaxID=58002 RepID=UPI0021A9E44A|nr:cytochrome P450 4C1-like isoform X2 [Daktulosphaira vitifoliae]